MKTTVVHCKRHPFDIYIGRLGPWGNPFSHKEGTMAKFKCETVEESVEKYKQWVLMQPHLLEKLPLLKEKVLGCWCKNLKNPTAICHGDVLAELSDAT